MARKTFVLSDGTKMIYEEWGEGRPFLFLSGNCCTRHYLTPYAQFFANEGYHTINLDYRGIGESIPSMTHPVTMELLGKDITEFIEVLDLKDLVLLGHSMGGDVIMEYIDKNGCDRLRAAIIIDSTCKIYTKEGDGWKYANNCGQCTYEQMMMASMIPFEDLMRQMTAGCMPDATEDMIEAALQAQLKDIEVSSMAELSDSLTHSDYREALSKFTIPTAYFYADDPRAIVHYKITDFYASQVKGPYEGIGIKTADHTFINTEVEMLSSMTKDFLNKYK